MKSSHIKKQITEIKGNLSSISNKVRNLKKDIDKKINELQEQEKSKEISKREYKNFLAKDVVEMDGYLEFLHIFDVIESTILNTKNELTASKIKLNQLLQEHKVGMDLLKWAENELKRWGQIIPFPLKKQQNIT